MPNDWRIIAQRIPEAVLIDVQAYSAELDAVDAAVRGSVGAHGERQTLSPFGWGDPVVRDSVVVGVERRPIAPVKSSDPGRAAVAVLQRLYLARKAMSTPGFTTDDHGELYVLLAMADRLLARKLTLSPESGRDLTILVNAPPLPAAHKRAYEYLTAILKRLESSFVPPVPPLMREPLKELLGTLSTPFVQHPWKGQRAGKAKVPKRYESACRRIERLLAEAQ